jgi:two-component system, NtrC family, sensor kinase
VTTLRTQEDGERSRKAQAAALEQLRHSDRVATLGWLASSMAHELGNPLNVIELRAQLIAFEEGTTLNEARTSATVILEQVQRMTRIIDEVLSFVRCRPARIEPVDVTSVVRKAIALCEHTAKAHQTRISLDDSAEVIEVEADADRLLQVFVNLAVNGAQAMSDGGALRFRVSQELLEHRPFVRIDVIDHGAGIVPGLMAKIFDPFFSTRGADGGTGLGLSVAQGIVRDYGGWIAVASTPDHGSTFSVHLPRRIHAS